MSEKAIIEYEYGRRNKYTFQCKAIRDWAEYFFEQQEGVWADPFFGKSPFKVQFKNDIEETGIDSHDWAKTLKPNSLDGIFFDPPYSMERVKRSYEGRGIESWQKQYGNQSGSFPQLKEDLVKALKPGGIVLSFGWNSTGFGSGRGFKKEWVMLCCHSGAARDTICTMEKKIK